jgi:zinc/manganese transport system permease protein
MSIYETLITPFADYGFMRRALAACIIMAVSSAPLGVFLVLRRMTLIGDAASHAILPGVAIAFMFFGLSVLPMTIGGLTAGLTMALVAGAITRTTKIKEDASFTAAYLSSLAVGVMIISMNGNAVDLLHVLFGNVLAVDSDSLFLVGSVASFTLLTMAVIYRPLIMECFDPNFLTVQKARGAIYHQLFLVLVVLNLVASFQSLGTMMAVGIMILPAISTRFWTKTIDFAILLSIVFGIFAAVIGLLLSYHYNLSSGPSIVLTASGWYLFSVFFGTSGGIIIRFFPRRHFHLENNYES